MRLVSLVRGWCAIVLLAAAACAAAPVPVIYSTDLLHPHEDPDDHFDLACLHALPEADLRAIVLDQGDRQVKTPGSTPVWQLNYLSGRHIPFAIGLRDKLKTPEDRGLDQPAAHQNGVHLILQTLQDSPEKVVVIFVGSARDVVAAYNREPDLFQRKVRAVYGFIGDAGDPGHQEWNVKLDPCAFIGIMRSHLPFYWVPCFDGGPGKNNGHASFWQAGHKQLLESAPPALQRYFLYMLRHATNEPIAYLAQPNTPAERDQLMQPQRNLWCSAILGMTVGRPLAVDGVDIAAFTPVEVSVDDDAKVHYGKSANSCTVMRFEVKDKARFSEVATRATAALLAAFPLARTR